VLVDVDGVRGLVAADFVEADVVAAAAPLAGDPFVGLVVEVEGAEGGGAVGAGDAVEGAAFAATLGGMGQAGLQVGELLDAGAVAVRVLVGSEEEVAVGEVTGGAGHRLRGGVRRDGWRRGGSGGRGAGQEGGQGEAEEEGGLARHGHLAGFHVNRDSAGTYRRDQPG
jgi:hypothetical protein